MARKGGLGKGLSALIPNADESDLSINSSLEIELALIEPRRDQPRIRFDPEAQADLVQSIRTQGVLQPLLVTPRGDKYILVAGERRYRASRAAGLYTVPCRVLDELDDQQLLEISLVENVQREDLNPIELAMGYRRMIEDLGMTQQQVADRVGKDRVTIANMLRLLKLPEPILNMVLDGELTGGHARALLMLKSDADRVAWAKKSVEQSLSVRDVEHAAQVAEKKVKPAPNPKKTPQQASQDVHASDVARQLEEKLGMSVDVKHKGPGGKVILHYNDLDDLDELIANLTMGSPPVE